MYDNLALSDNGFLFDTRTGATFNLSRTGTFLVRALQSAVPEDALAERLAETFEVTVDAARRDVAQFLFRLKDLQLIGGASC